MFHYFEVGDLEQQTPALVEEFKSEENHLIEKIIEIPRQDLIKKMAQYLVHWELEKTDWIVNEPKEASHFETITDPLILDPGPQPNTCQIIQAHV